MKKLFFGFILFSITTIAHAAVPTVVDFPFEKNIQLPSLSSQQEVRVELDQEVLNAVSSRFGNFSIFDKQNTPIEYDLFFRDFYRTKDVTVVDVSSAKDGFDSQIIVDDNVLTTFIFNERVDGRDASWALLDLGKEVPLTRLEVFTPESAKIRFVALDGGRTKDSLKTIVSKRPMQQRLELDIDSIRFLKISFWGIQVKVDDIRITVGPSGSVYFPTLPGKNIRMLYGGNEVDFITYSERISSEKTGLPIAYLGRQTFNDQFPTDIDEDRVEMEEDNCPFVSNSSQRDSDGDRIGNDCDNAPEVINSRQGDIDRDGIGDVIDNCKLVSNLDQADRDEDGWGDACDNAHIDESGTMSFTLKVIGGIVALLLLFVGLWFAKFTRKSKR